MAQEADTSPELFSAVMQRVSVQPEFRERVLQGIREVPKVGEFLSPDLVDRLRVLILGKEWQRVDHFPALTIFALNKSVDTAARLAGNSAKPLAPFRSAGHRQVSARAGRDHRPRSSCDDAHLCGGPATAQRQIGFNLTMGDGPDPALAPMHAASRQLAAVLNRLAMNGPGKPQAIAVLDGKSFPDGGSLLGELAASGHHVSITDDVYFANFGHLHDGAARGDDAVLGRHTDRRACQPPRAPAAGQPL